MSFLDLVQKRYSVRNYQDRPVPRELLLQILEAARWAPTAVNLQPFKLIILQEEKIRERVAACYQRDWLQTAPLLVVICGDHNRAWHRGDGKDHCDVDAGIIGDHLTLAATDLGLGSCWVCNFDADQCREVLGLPAEWEPIALLPLGYAVEPADLSRHQTRRPLSELVAWHGWEAKP